MVKRGRTRKHNCGKSKRTRVKKHGGRKTRKGGGISDFFKNKNERALTKNDFNNNFFTAIRKKLGYSIYTITFNGLNTLRFLKFDFKIIGNTGNLALTQKSTVINTANTHFRVMFDIEEDLIPADVILKDLKIIIYETNKESPVIITVLINDKIKIIKAKNTMNKIFEWYEGIEGKNVKFENFSTIINNNIDEIESKNAQKRALELEEKTKSTAQPEEVALEEVTPAAPAPTSSTSKVYLVADDFNKSFTGIRIKDGFAIYRITYKPQPQKEIKMDFNDVGDIALFGKSKIITKANESFKVMFGIELEIIPQTATLKDVKILITENIINKQFKKIDGKDTNDYNIRITTIGANVIKEPINKSMNDIINWFTTSTNDVTIKDFKTPAPAV
jgi:hypothetical protein